MSEFQGTDFHNHVSLMEENPAPNNAISTVIPEELLATAEGHPIATMSVVIIGVLFAIIALFGMAVFIDCRYHQTNSDSQRRKSLRAKLPFLRQKNADHDTEAFANQMCEANNTTPAPAIAVITEATIEIAPSASTSRSSHNITV